MSVLSLPQTTPSSRETLTLLKQKLKNKLIQDESLALMNKLGGLKPDRTYDFEDPQQLVETSSITKPMPENIKWNPVEGYDIAPQEQTINITPTVIPTSPVAGGEGRDEVREYINRLSNMPSTLYGGVKAEGGQEEIDKRGFSFEVDKLPRFEIDDSGSKIDASKLEQDMTSDELVGRLGDAFIHPEMEKRYPKIMDKRLRISSDMPQGMKGSYTPKGNFLIGVGTPEQMRETLIHEVDHAIGETEGFTQGGTNAVGGLPSEGLAMELARHLEATEKIKGKEATAKYQKQLMKAMKGDKTDFVTAHNARAVLDETYRKLGGEISARDSANRMNMTAEERKNPGAKGKGPLASQGVPVKEMIYKAPTDGKSLSVEPKAELQSKLIRELEQLEVTKKTDKSYKDDKSFAKQIDMRVRDIKKMLGE